MRKFKRADEPEFLTDRWENWGLEWEERRKKDGKAQFHWHEVEGQGVNHKLLPLLKSQTQDHCSFCDAFPVSPPSIETIEHFRPKSSFPRDAYRWMNLYFCCTHCQQKGSQFDEALLSPDAIEYQFEDYFRWDFTKGTLEVNEQAPLENQRRARITIDFYKLNEGHPRWRRREMLIRQQRNNVDLDDFAYRNFIDN